MTAARCVILAAGPVDNPEALRGLLREDDWFVAADGGLRLAQRLGVQPQAVVADFDSGTLPAELQAEIHRLPVEKDWTDTMAAADLGLRRGFRRFLLLGGTGGRLDHTMANLAVLRYLLGREAQAMMADEHNRVQMIKPSAFTVEPMPGWKLSVFPYGGEVRGLSLQGLKYPLHDKTLTAEECVGVSNEFLDCPARISFREGTLLLFFSKD